MLHGIGPGAPASCSSTESAEINVRRVGTKPSAGTVRIRVLLLQKHQFMAGGVTRLRPFISTVVRFYVSTDLYMPLA